MSEERCLHCDINEVVQQHMEGEGAINLPDLIAKMGESLVDLILLGPEDQWSNLLCRVIGAVRFWRKLAMPEGESAAKLPKSLQVGACATAIS